MHAHMYARIPARRYTCMVNSLQSTHGRQAHVSALSDNLCLQRLPPPAIEYYITALFTISTCRNLPLSTDEILNENALYGDLNLPAISEDILNGWPGCAGAAAGQDVGLMLRDHKVDIWRSLFRCVRALFLASLSFSLSPSLFSPPPPSLCLALFSLSLSRIWLYYVFHMYVYVWSSCLCLTMCVVCICPCACMNPHAIRLHLRSHVRPREFVSAVERDRDPFLRPVQSSFTHLPPGPPS